MDERPLWIDLLLRSGLPRGCFESRYALHRQEMVRNNVEECISQESGRTAALRKAALEELANSDWRVVERALAYLLVVGRAPDAVTISRLKEHPEECIRKGVKACLFEVRRRPGEAEPFYGLSDLSKTDDSVPPV